MADFDWGGAESALKSKSGEFYDSSMLEDLKRNVSYGQGDQVDQNSVNDWVNRIGNKAKLRGSNEVNSTYRANGQGGVTVGPTGKVNDPNGTGGGGGNAGGGNATAQQWNGQAAPSAAEGMLKQMQDQAAAAAAENKAKSDALYGQLLQRAQQGTAVSPNDPVIKAQTEAYTANTDRSTRNYLADRAEQAGPYANLAGEQRMATERSGQAAGSFTAELMGRELTSRRQEISDALNGMRGMLSLDQQNQLQRELGVMDDAIKRQGLSLASTGQNQSYDLGLRGAATAGRGVDLGFLNAGNQNQQFYNELGLRANQYGAENYFRGAGL